MVTEKPKLIYVTTPEALMIRLHTELSVLDDSVVEILERYEIGSDRNDVLGMHLRAYLKDFRHITADVSADGVSDKNSFCHKIVPFCSHTTTKHYFVRPPRIERGTLSLKGTFSTN